MTTAVLDSIIANIDAVDAETPVRKIRKPKAKEAIVTTNPSPESDAQSRTSALSDLIEVSGRTAEQASALKGGIAGYEASFVASVAAFAAARKAGNTEDQCRKALQADQKQSGSRHFGATDAGGSAMDLLASLSNLEGDLPEGFVFRPASNSTADGVPLLEGETSLVALIRKVQAPAEAATLKSAGFVNGKAYGKAVVRSLIEDAVDKAAAIAALEAQVRLLAKAVKEANAKEAAPKDAVKYLKAASGPIGKVAEALDAGLVGDAAEVRTLIDTLTTLLAEAKAHSALV